ncbi:MAG: acetyl-CoA carboxylase, carboxyltransferase subunit beta [bacterium]
MWFKKTKRPQKLVGKKRIQIPEGVWIKCNYCKEIIYRKELEKNCHVCPKCDYHFSITALQRLSQMYDKGEYEEFNVHIYPKDPLKFRDRKKYKDRLREYQEKTGLKDALISSQGNIDGMPVIMCAMAFNFMGGSMASVVGEKIVRSIEKAIEEKKPFITIAASGGARMQEGVISLMQMAKTSAALTKLSEARLPFFSILTDPTTGGVSASFAMLGDIIIAEPKALIGFAGPRVIEKTINEKLPEGFQRAEFLLEHGIIDMIVPRQKMRDTLSRLLKVFVF